MDEEKLKELSEKFEEFQDMVSILQIRVADIEKFLENNLRYFPKEG